MPIFTLAAAAVGYSDQWSVTGGGANKVTATATKDGTTSYISETVNNRIQAFTLEDLPGNVARINSVKVTANGRSTPAATDSFGLGVRLSATNSAAPAITLTTAFADYTTAAIARPGGGSWTVPDVNALEMFAISNIAGGNTLQISYMAAVIDAEYGGGGFAFLVGGLVGAMAWLDLPRVLGFLRARHGLIVRPDEYPALLSALGAPARS